MMKIEILSIGSLREKYLKDAETEYTKRLSRYAKVDIVEMKEARLPAAASLAEEETVKRTEGVALLAKLGIVFGKNSKTNTAERSSRYIIALDVRGKSLSSEELADKFSNLTISGKSTITFIIGGSLGLSAEVLAASDLRLSFSAMTFPHQLMRVILLEQIYRSFKINSGETYHK